MKPRKVTRCRVFGLRLLSCFFILACIGLLSTGNAVAAGATWLGGGLVVESLWQRTPTGYLRIYTGTTLGEIFIPEVYGTIQPNDSPERTAFVESGAAVTNPLLQQAAQSGAKKVEVPLWNDLDASVPPNLSDDTDNKATPGKVNTTDYSARNAFLNKGYGTADLAVELSGTTPGNGDPMTRIKNRFGSYWMKQFQYRILAACRGIMAANVAQNGGDMVHDVALETTVGVSDDNLISAEAIVETVFTMGDRFDQLAVIAMHSIVYKRLVLRELITFVKDSTGTLSIPTYLGKRVVVDDGLPVIAGTTSGFKYLTVLFGAGAIGYGEGSPKVPVEVERLPSSGMGGGLENIWERKTWLIHPAGFDWTEASVANISPALSELRMASNWQRVLPRKMVPLGFLLTNG
jgi:Major capsid protein 13-like